MNAKRILEIVAMVGGCLYVLKLTGLVNPETWIPKAK